MILNSSAKSDVESAGAVQASYEASRDNTNYDTYAAQYMNELESAQSKAVGRNISYIVGGVGLVAFGFSFLW